MRWASAEKDRSVIFASDNGGLHVLESPGTPATHNTPFRPAKVISTKAACGCR
jgi:hypothetical protein